MSETKVLESKSAANVSPSMSFELPNECTLTVNFQHDGQVALIGKQRGNVTVGILTPEQAAELRDLLKVFLEKRGA